MNIKSFTSIFFAIALLTQLGCQSSTKPGQLQQIDGAYIITGKSGNKLRITPYGEQMARIQAVRPGEAFFPDNHYEMVVHHDWPKNFELLSNPKSYIFKTSKLSIVIDRESLTSEFFIAGKKQSVLKEKKPITWSNNAIEVEFEADKKEHFSGLGHGYYARANSIDLKGQVIERNYGSQPIEQAPLIVPFYMSGKGYGIFLNSTFQNKFSFAANDKYGFSIDDLGFSGRMDYFFIAGPKLPTILDNYTQLTGRPRLPQKAMFGLQLSDKGHDHNSKTPSDEQWWRQKIMEHREAGFPLDHVINDNRWRAAGGKRCESKIDWDKTRYPDPADYQKWLQDNGLVITLDFNRCIAQYSEGWQASFNVPQTGTIEFPDSAPDLTNEAFQKWFWQVFHQNALKPEKSYPGDALWIDEFDEQGHAPKHMMLSNSRSSGEMRNYWFFLIAKALVKEGWDKSSLNKRPFVWVRGMTAGAQRYATLWSGDIYPNYKDMEGQIRGMQLAGLSGFTYWGHDAGGFYDWDKGLGPDENMYQRWAMAFGSFAPIWKPHGMGQSRWPLDRGIASQKTAHKFSNLRYRLMPYIYTAAKEAAQSGLPMARPMILDYQEEENAWKFDLQYMWGDNLLVAPLTQDFGTKSVWLPNQTWYKFESGQTIPGDQVIEVSPAINELPIFVKAGAIVPERKATLSTAFIDKTHLILNIYAGADGEFLLMEDDDVTEAHRTKGEHRTTRISYSHKNKSVTIAPAQGTYQNAPKQRKIKLRIFGLNPIKQALVNNQHITVEMIGEAAVLDMDYASVRDKIIVQL